MPLRLSDSSREQSADQLEFTFIGAETFFRMLFQTFLEMKDIMLSNRVRGRHRGRRESEARRDAARLTSPDHLRISHGFAPPSPPPPCLSSRPSAPATMSTPLGSSGKTGSSGSNAFSSDFVSWQPPCFASLARARGCTHALKTPLPPACRNFTKQLDMYATVLTVLALARQSATTRAGVHAYLNVVTLCTEYFTNFTARISAAMLCRADWVRIGRERRWAGRASVETPALERFMPSS